MYETPTPEEFRAWLKAKGLTGAEAGRLVGVDSRAVRRWTSPPDTTSFREIPWSAWALLRLMMGEISLEQARGETLPGE